MKHFLISALLFVFVGFATFAFCEIFSYEVDGYSLVTNACVSGTISSDENNAVAGRLCYSNGTCHSVYGAWSGLGIALVNSCLEEDSFEVEVVE